ncbi:MAG: hypothetical protein ABW065_03180 [Solirubrobacterales bacterium]
MRQLAPRFSAVGERNLRRALKRTVRRGLLLERKSPEGAGFVALTSEGWKLQRSQSASG